MNAIQQRAPIISHGPNAGQPRPSNDILLDRLHSAMAALIVLKRNGYQVINIALEGISPRLWIENCARCSELPEAITVKWGYDSLGAYQVREIKLHAVRVCWIVRGH